MLETVLNHLKIGNELPRWTLSVYFSIKWCLNNFRLGPVVGLTQTLSDMLCISYLPSKLELVLVDFFFGLYFLCSCRFLAKPSHTGFTNYLTNMSQELQGPYVISTRWPQASMNKRELLLIKQQLR